MGFNYTKITAAQKLWPITKPENFSIWSGVCKIEPAATVAVVAAAFGSGDGGRRRRRLAQYDQEHTHNSGGLRPDKFKPIADLLAYPPYRTLLDLHLRTKYATCLTLLLFVQLIFVPAAFPSP